jgi:hypothetical protein
MTTVGFIGTGRMGAPMADHTAIVKLLGWPGGEGVRQ